MIITPELWYNNTIDFIYGDSYAKITLNKGRYPFGILNLHTDNLSLTTSINFSESF